MSRTYRTCPVTFTQQRDSKVVRDKLARSPRTHADGTVTFDWSDERTSDQRAFSKARRRGDAVLIRTLVEEFAHDQAIQDDALAAYDYRYTPAKVRRQLAWEAEYDRWVASTYQNDPLIGPLVYNREGLPS